MIWEIHFALNSPNFIPLHTALGPFVTLVLSYGICCHIRWRIPKTSTCLRRTSRSGVKADNVSLLMYSNCIHHGPLVGYVKLWVAHAPGMPGTFSPPPRISAPDMHHGTCVTHVPWWMPGSLTNGALWSWRREKRFRHFRRMRNPQFYVSGKGSIAVICILLVV